MIAGMAVPLQKRGLMGKFSCLTTLVSHLSKPKQDRSCWCSLIKREKFFRVSKRALCACVSYEPEDVIFELGGHPKISAAKSAKIVCSIWTKKTDFKMELFEFEEQKMFRNLLSWQKPIRIRILQRLNPKIITWHFRFKNPKFFSLFNFEIGSEQIFFFWTNSAVASSRVDLAR